MEKISLSTYKQLNEDLLRFLSHYQPIRTFVPPEPDKKPKRIHKKYMICRFCGKKRPEVNFKSDPHIIPKLFGENYGVSDFECDECNGLFSLNESHMADYLSLIRTLNTVGKRRTPKFKSPKDSLTAIMSNIFDKPALEISDNSGDGFEIDKATGTTTIHYLKKPHIPFNVYKCLLKIALTVLPEQYIVDYPIAFNMIRTGKNYEWFLPLAEKMFQTTVDFHVIKPYCILFEKTNPLSALPSHIFKLYFHNIIFQFPIPLNLQDSPFYETGTLKIVCCPPLFINENHEGESSNAQIDLSNLKTVRDSKGFITLKSDPENINNLDAYDPKTKTFIEKPYNPEKILKIFLTKDSDQINNAVI